MESTRSAPRDERPPGKRLRHAADYALLRSIQAGAARLPWHSLRPWGRRLGRAAWHVAPVRRDVVLANLRAAFGAEQTPAEIEGLARRFYVELGTTLLEFCAFSKLGPEGVRRITVIENEHYLEEVRREGRGALLVSGHYGNWELQAAAVAARGYPVQALAKTQSNPRVDRLQNDLRRRVGVGIIRVGPSLKEMIRALRRGDLVGLLGDQDAGPLGHFVEFLGRPASVYRGPAAYAYRLGCPLLTGFPRRLPDGTHVLRFNAPHRADPAWDEATAIARLTEAHTRELEEAVRAAPEHYWWVHRRWKTQPPAAGAAAG
ncbi:MAG: lysophospholipid acyltransferase family protein [Candidatus Krumholzibacteriia bacterium]